MDVTVSEIKETQPSKSEEVLTKKEASKKIKKTKAPIKKAVKKVKAVVKDSKQKRTIKKFMDEEAKEGEDSDENEVVNLTTKEADTYSKEFLRPKAERLNHSLVD